MKRWKNCLRWAAGLLVLAGAVRLAPEMANAAQTVPQLKLAERPYACAAPFVADCTVTDGAGNGVFSGGIFSQVYRITDENQQISILAYPLGVTGEILEDTFRRVNLEDAGTFDTLTAGKIRAAVLHGYPCRDTVSIQTAANQWLQGRGLPEIRELQTGEAVLATQLAVWQLCGGENVTVNRYVSGWRDMTTDGWRGYRKNLADGEMTAQKPTEFTSWNVEGLCRYLWALDPAQPGLGTVSEAALENPVYTSAREEDGTYTVTVTVDIQTSVDEDDNLTLTADCGGLRDTQPVTRAGSYSVCFPGLSSRPEVRLTLSGTQHGGDVYLFQGENQSLVGFDDSLLPVRGELVVKPDCVLNIYESTKEGVPLSNIRFDIYRVAARAGWETDENLLLSPEEALERCQTPGNLVTILTTDIRGFATFNFTESGQPEGVYLVAQRFHSAAAEVAAPFLLVVPGMTETGESCYTLNVHPTNTPETAPAVELNVGAPGRTGGSFDAGQSHTWILRGKVPAGMVSAQSYTLSATLDSGLNYEEGSAEVTLLTDAGTELRLREGDHYTVAENSAARSLTVSLTPAGMAYAGANDASEVWVRFQGEIQETAEPGTPIMGHGSLRYRNGVGIAYPEQTAETEVHTGAIRLLVTDEAGNGLPGTKLKILRAGEETAEVTTDADGWAVVYGLACGNYTLIQTEATEGYHPIREEIPITVNEKTSRISEAGDEIQLVNTVDRLPNTGDVRAAAMITAGSILLGLACTAVFELTLRVVRRKIRQ